MSGIKNSSRGVEKVGDNGQSSNDASCSRPNRKKSIYEQGRI